ncbi:MAG: hypothetical protein ACNI25_02005 [Halarcobacter sp.]
MQFLESIESKFEKLSTFIKIELFISPCILVLIFYYFQEPKKLISKNFINSGVEVNKLHMNINMLEVLNDIEKFAIKNNIKLLNISNTQDRVKVSIKTKSFYDFIIFLNFLEHYNSFSKIISIEDNSILKEIEIGFDRFYVKKDSDFIKQIDKKTTLNKKFNLKAIVNKKLFIDNRWLKIGDTLGKYKIVEIDKNSIYLKSEKSVLKLEVFNGK